MLPRSRTTALGAALALGLSGLTACAEQVTAPDATLAGSTPTAAAVKAWDANAATRWNAVATTLNARRPQNVGRLYAYLSLAQLRAGEAAQAIRPHPPTASAIGAASAAVLRAYFPLDVGVIDSELAAQAAADPWPGAKHQDWNAGAPLGAAAAARVLLWSAGDRIGLADPLLSRPAPAPGQWVWNPGAPLARGSYGARPMFLATGSELRPLPPPDFASPTFADALAEVLRIADTLSDAQRDIARYWNVNQSATSARAMNELALELLRTYRRGDVESARILFLMNGAAFDAAVGCFDAKYHYWYIRPPQAAPSIVPVIPMPPHPSYPSGHSCVSGSSTELLALAFPEERPRLEAVAQQASLSRLYAGIHYRFDMVAGLALGRAAAAKAWAADLDAVAVR